MKKKTPNVINLYILLYTLKSVLTSLIFSLTAILCVRYYNTHYKKRGINEYIYAIEYYASIKKNEVLPFVTNGWI